MLDSSSQMNILVARPTNFDGVAAFVLGSRLTLQTLTLSFLVRCRNDPWGSLSREVTALADQSLPALKRLIISTSHCSCGNIPSSELERLDKALAGDGYPSLQNVVLVIKASQSQLDECDIPKTYRRHLSRVDNLNAVKLTISLELQESQ